MTLTNNLTHSIMFHHFHDDKHPISQGSISGDEFTIIINWVKQKFNLIGAKEYSKRFLKGNLTSLDVCLSFDDALKCQYDIAVPIMEKLGIDAFFFVYSSIFSKTPDMLEVYRFFRTVAYKDIDEFYFEFFSHVENIDKKNYQKIKYRYREINYLNEYPFYSENDKWFRYLRDQYLKTYQYQNLMNEIITKKNFDIEEAKRCLWINKNELINLQKVGHTIGLHSFSHPMRISKLSPKMQAEEYKKNYEQLFEILGKPISSVAHPCGDYNQDTLKILTNMGIKIGFRSSMSIKNIKSALEIPREDHSNILREIKLNN